MDYTSIAIYLLLSVFLFAGNKNGNRRTANIRSVGYSDVFVLSKEALWNALREYPEAKKKLIEKGRQLLMKDRLLEDWATTGEVTEDMKTEQRCQRIKKIESMLNKAQTRLALLMAGITSVQQHLMPRLERLEELTSCHTSATATSPTNVGEMNDAEDTSVH